MAAEIKSKFFYLILLGCIVFASLCTVTKKDIIHASEKWEELNQRAINALDKS